MTRGAPSTTSFLRAWAPLTASAALALATVAALTAGCERTPSLDDKPSAKPAAAPSAPPSIVAPLADDAQTPSRLCMQLGKLLGQSKGQISPIDSTRCVQQFEGRKHDRPELYPCTSQCVMIADDIETGMQCSGMCNAPADACKDVPAAEGAQAHCIERFGHLQQLRTAPAFRCAARCGTKYDTMPGVAACLGGECGL